MKTFIVTAELSKPYEQWEEGFLDHADLRAEFGIEDVFHGQIEDEERIVVILRAESQDVLDDLMQTHADEIAQNGHILESTEVIVAI
ncbi:MAG TPA: DUF3764 family protein [Orrella sp.]